MGGAVFPWRSANRFELLIDGPNFFPQMLVGIARAEQQVELELYLVEAGACAEAMVQALVPSGRVAGSGCVACSMTTAAWPLPWACADA